MFRKREGVQRIFFGLGTIILIMVLPLMQAGKALAANMEPGEWLAGDFHQHTTYTDGSTVFDFVMMKNAQFGLDWWANSEHGGSYATDGNGHYWDDTSYHPAGTILGDVVTSGGHQKMWRWQSLRDFVFPQISYTRFLYPDKRIFSGYEWNVPGHEHCSVGVVAEDASAISAFEYVFDKSDSDTSRTGEVTPYGVLPKRNGYVYTFPNGVKTQTPKTYPEMHRDSVAACATAQKLYDYGMVDNAWIVFAHIERAGAWTPEKGGGYNIEHFRDFNNAGPDVCFGFEGAPGHQVEPYRGFGNEVDCSNFATTGVCTSKDFGGTYGGTGYYTAKVGGLWDALLGEGRHWFNFASSDYHQHWTAGSSDFYPGEYQKDYVYVKGNDGYSMNEIADGLRSGNSFFVMGDLINHLEFSADNGTSSATMGEDLRTSSPIINDLAITIKFRSPIVNNNGDFPTVDHVDLISGDITGRIDPSSPEYSNPVNDSAKVIASFSASDWQSDADGNNVIVYHISNLDRSKYFRLRGTNLPCGTPDETGPAMALPSQDYCSPLPDALLYPNDAQKAFADIWFYSNPIFVYVQ